MNELVLLETIEDQNPKFEVSDIVTQYNTSRHENRYVSLTIESVYLNGNQIKYCYAVQNGGYTNTVRELYLKKEDI